jgi:Mlc titration factor MtfA (ptsG expression regulator)
MLGWLFKKKAPFQPISRELWGAATAPYLFMRGLAPAQSEKLRLIASDFLHTKQIVGAGGLEVSQLMRVQIAAQASILVMELGLEYFEGWSDVILYPAQFVPEREVVDEAGVVHTTNDPLAGEAWLGGPVVLSYEDVAMASNEEDRVEGFNVVIHEFAHKLDMLNGDANGFPPLHKGMSTETWKRVFMEAYLDFCKRVDHADVRSRRLGSNAYDNLLIDPYASENPAEFFAVISEAFFETPDAVQSEYPKVYEQLKLFYKQDPLGRLA